MCQEIIFEDKTEVAYIAEAREVFTVFVLHPSYKRLGNDADCLCCLDIPACAEANGYDCVDDDSGTYHLTKKGAVDGCP